MGSYAKYYQSRAWAMSDVDMMLMLKQRIRGGVAMDSNWFSQANNKYMGDAYVCCKPSKYIHYLDANDVYGWEMSKPLSTGGFKWMKEEINNWRNVPCILQVDLEYSEDFAISIMTTLLRQKIL